MTDLRKNSIPGEGEPLGTEMTPEELARYRTLLEGAYPQPPDGLRASVMARIKAEAASKPPVRARNSRNSRRGIFVRWGSLAACAALAILVGVRVLPGVMKNTQTADSADFAVRDESAAEFILEGTAERMPLYSEPSQAEEAVPVSPEKSGDGRASERPGSAPNGLPGGVLKLPDEAPAPNVPAPAAEAPADVPSVEAEPASSGECYEAEYETFTPTEEKALADSVPWVDRSFRASGSSVPDALIAMVGEDAYWSWLGAGGDGTLVGFALSFGLTAEDILGTGNLWYYVDVPADLPLTEENRAALYTYYADGGDYAAMVRRYAAYEFKSRLIVEAGTSAYARWLESRGGDVSLRSWTVSELAEAFGIPEDVLRAVYENAVEKTAAVYPGYELPDYEELARS